MSTRALVRRIVETRNEIKTTKKPRQITCVRLGISSLLVVLALAMLVEAVLALVRFDGGRSRPNAPATVLATG